ncbi:MAG: T9SS type A sorting domain-containing protein [Vicingaceae bacterium]
MKVKQLINLFISFLLISSLASQNRAWKLLNTNDGLSSDIVQAIYVENDSAIWIGTSKGLCFYNGSQVLTYFIGGLSLAEQSIHEIEATGNTMWLRTNKGVTSYDGSNFVNYDTTSGLLSNDIKDISTDSQGNLWIGSSSGVSKFNGSIFTHYPNIGASVLGIDSADRVYALDPPLLLPSVNTVKIFNGSQWDTITANPNLNLATIQRLFKSEDGRLLAETGHSLFYEFNYPFTPQATQFAMPFSYPPSCLAVDGNTIWAGVNHGGSSLCFTEDSVMQFFNAGLTYINCLELAHNKLYVGTKQGLAYANKNARPLKLDNDFDLNEIGINIRADQGVFENSFGEVGFEVPKGSGLGAIYTSDFITIAKKGNWISNPGLASPGASPGPLNSNRLGFEWPYVVNVSQAEIDMHKSSYNQTGYQMPDGIKNWPANGDSTLNISLDLAPFKDANNNGCYDPQNGDYPIIKGKEALYWIKHSADPNLKLEYHYMLYGFNRQSDQDINQVVFLDFRIINRENARIDSLKTGYFVDWDLGNPADDYIGCDSLTNTFYIYDADTVGRGSTPQAPYGNNPPFVGAKFLSDSMTSFIRTFAPNGQTQINLHIHYVNLLNARWPNGTPLHYGGDGFLNSSTIPTSYMFSGNPYTQTGWTEANPGNGLAPFAPGDRRGIASIPYYSLNAGESKTISVALGFGRKDSVQSHLENFSEMQGVLATAKAVYDTISPKNPDYGSNYNCTLVGLPEVHGPQKVELSVFPNPSNGYTTLKSDQVLEELQVFSMSGKLLLQQRLRNKENTFNLSAFPEGIYLLRVLREDKKWESRKILLKR